MEDQVPLVYSYKETRLNFDPTSKANTISISLPTAPSSLSSVKQAKSVVAIVPNAEDEVSFRQKHLATFSSIYHRKFFDSPRSFLWRVLENERVLSINVVDFSTSQNVSESYNFTLRFTFPHLIVPTCITFSDSKDQNVLYVFVLTESKQVWTLSLRPEFFRDATSMDENILDWCNVYSPRSLGIKTPHRLAALSEDDLLISFHDGALARLERNEKIGESPWKEQQYNEGGWSHSFRSMVPFHGTNGIYYQGHYIQPSAATSIVSPVTMIDNTLYAFTVTVSHRLRIWNLYLGNIAYTGDLLTQELEPPSELKQTIDPSLHRLIQVINCGDRNILCVTYSPLGSGEFKFWSVLGNDNGSLRLLDLFPNNSLTPRTPSPDIWTVADFAVLYNENSEDILSVWVLWKNNLTYQLLKLDFPINAAIPQIRDIWSQGWRAVALDQLRDIPVPKIVPCNSSDVTDQWLDFILCPGRFSTATIETGLAIYEQGLGLENEASCKCKSLVDRMCTTIASTVVLARSSDGSLDFEKFRSATYIQWMRFYRLLIDLHDQQGEAMSLVVDPNSEMPWVILADGVSVIRKCSHLEKKWHNHNRLLERGDRISLLLHIATNFRKSNSESFFFTCNSFLREEIHQEPSLTIRQRMRQLYEKCDFANQIGDETCEELLISLDGQFEDITLELYTSIFEPKGSLEDLKVHSSVSHFTDFGIKLLVRGVQQVTQLHHSVCVDQMILLIFIENEVNNFEDGIQIDTAPIYNQLALTLSRLELVLWLTGTQVLSPIKKNESIRTDLTNSSKDKRITTDVEVMTVFEGVLRHMLDIDIKGQKMSSLITEIIVNLCASNSKYEIFATEIQAFLLKLNRPDLALECSLFAENDALSTYIQGRTYLAFNDTTTAALLFKKAAVGIAFPNSEQQYKHRSVDYLCDFEEGLFNSGLSKYYSHIVALFQKDYNDSYVTEFAQLSLQFIGDSTEEQDIRTRMLMYLLDGALNTSQFDIAYSALNRLKNPTSQYLYLDTFVTKMCETLNASYLLELPFTSMQDKVEDILIQKCNNVTDVLNGIPYHKILCSWYIKHNNFRGAASILLKRLQRLQQSSSLDEMVENNQFETPITQQYISLINTLSCLDSNQAWILFETQDSINSSNREQIPNRQVITLSDLRNEYQAELDRLAAIQNNQFQYEGSDTNNILST